MSNPQDLRIEPVAPSGHAEPVHAAPRTPEALKPAEPPKLPAPQDVSVVSEGQLRSAYAEFLLDPQTHDVVVRIRDAATGRVLDELPSKEVQAVQKAMAEYAEKMARHRAAMQASAGA
jgi:FlaG protein